MTIPATLHDSLMARLDRLEIAKRVAQLSAVLGRQFDYGLLKAVWEQDEYL
jgi:predicted ATPase